MNEPANDLKIVLPDGWKRAKGFSYGVYAPDRMPLFVAGQLAVVDGAAAPAADMGFSDQFELALRNVMSVVEAAGGLASDIASLRVFVTSVNAFKAAQKEIALSWRSVLGAHFPAMTLVEVAALFESTASVEIEAVALLKKENSR